jgi:hypothetical protein
MWDADDGRRCERARDVGMGNELVRVVDVVMCSKLRELKLR